MSEVKLSLYCYLFNSQIRSFDLDGTLDNFLSFADEVVIATLGQQDDDTLDRLLRAEDSRPNLKVVVTDIDPLTNNRFDGDLKTAALQACTHPIRIIADCDERFVIRQRSLWDEAARRLLANPYQDGWLIPVVDLYGSPETIRLNEPIGLKFRMHKDTVARRGVHYSAERGNGLLDTSRSDTTEALLANGEFARFMELVPSHLRHPSLTSFLNDYIYVLHLGYLDLSRRAKISKEWWLDRWQERSGQPEQVVTNEGDLRAVPTIKHSLKFN